jgi:hypothetical protein
VPTMAVAAAALHSDAHSLVANASIQIVSSAEHDVPFHCLPGIVHGSQLTSFTHASNRAVPLAP